MDKPPSKNDDTWFGSATGMFSKIVGAGPSLPQNLPRQSEASKVPEATAGNVPVPSGGSLKSIRTPHQPAHSHPGESPRFSQTMPHCAQLSLLTDV